MNPYWDQTVMPEVITQAGTASGWDSDHFENQMAGTVIGLYERPERASKDTPYVSEGEIAHIRDIGAFVPHPTRIALAKELDAPLDRTYKGCFVLAWCQEKTEHPERYQYYGVLKKAQKLPTTFRRVMPGTLYAVWSMSAKHGELTIANTYFTTRNSSIYPCLYKNRDGRWRTGIVPEYPTMLANFQGDASHTWSIESKDSIRVTVGCYHEEVKSLLYARSLPMTSSGRKRPILHLVHAHRRRLRAGTDINIDEFLRGVKKIEMGGAVFQVAEPTSVRARIETRMAVKESIQHPLCSI